MDESSFPWLTKDQIAKIEEQLNPAQIAFPPPKSWACPQIDMALKKAYKEKFPKAPFEPDYERAKVYLAKELNHIMQMRINNTMANNSIEAWRKETFPGNECFSGVAVVAANRTMNVGCSPPTTAQKPNPPESTLPLESQCAPSSISISVGTGRGISTVNGNGEPSSYRNMNLGPSPRRAASRPRRGSRGNRSNQPRSGLHPCPFPGCDKAFQYLSKLKDHEHTHLPAKAFSCTLGSCTKSFKRQRELKAHVKTHPGHEVTESEGGDQEMIDPGSGEGDSKPDEVKDIPLDKNPPSPSPSTPTGAETPSDPDTPHKPYSHHTVNPPSSITLPSMDVPVSKSPSPGSPKSDNERPQELKGNELKEKLEKLAAGVVLKHG